MNKPGLNILLFTLILTLVFSVQLRSVAQSKDALIFRMPENITSDDYFEGEIIFKLKEEFRPSEKLDQPADMFFESILGNLKASKTKRLFPKHTAPEKSLHASGQPYADLSLIYSTFIPDDASLEKAINSLYVSGIVEYAQPRYLPELLYEPDDPFTGSQYYLQNIHAFEAWAIEQGDTNIVIAITDTGIDLLHPDLINAIAYNYDDPINGEDTDNDGYIDNFHGWDLGENDNNPQYNGSAHGVHVSGIAGASTDNGTGIAGVGFNSRILPVKISDADGRLVKAYEGIVYAADQGAQIINCSWGGFISPGQFGQDIINYAVFNRNAVVIAAAGNSNNQARMYPASYANSISVAATNSQDIKWNDSSYGNLIDLSAPGAGIFSTWTNGSYITSSGTSMAAPAVAGAAALLRSYYPDYSALQIAAQLKVTTDIIDTIPENETYAGLLGAGRLNIMRALTENDHPYLMLSQFEYPEEYYRLFNPGETFNLGARFINLLATTQNITAKISTTSQYIEILSDEALLGTIEHMETVDNFEEPFLLQIQQNMPPSREVDFIISFFTENGTFAGRQNFSMTFNLDYVTIDNNQIQTTINSKGNIGYNYPDYNQGVGFLYSNTNQNRTLIKSAGFMAGISTAKVVDNIYGAVEDSFSNLLYPHENARILDDPLYGDIHISGIFSDTLAGMSRAGIKVYYDIYAFSETPLDKFMILEYNIVNISGENLPGFYAGFFADWSLQDIRNHRAAFDADNKLGYAFSANGGHYTGIQLLSHDNINHYAFDNQGFGGSIRINNGFTSFDKYTALRTNRNNAGFFDKDNDISTLVSAGPFIIPNPDTLHIAFALLAGDHINDLRASAQLAALIYNGEDPLTTDHINKPVFGLYAYPVPFADYMNISFLPGNNSSAVEIRIYDMKARLKFRKKIDNPLSGKQNLQIDTSQWPEGSYIIQIINDNVIESLRVTKR
ncbi:MAG: S8 family serine peptidase [Bacteroidales bacterium]